MHLTQEEQKMLDGEYGYSKQKSMEILYQLGRIYEVDSMIPVKSVHMPGASVVVAGYAGTNFVEKLSENNTKFSAFTTLNTAALDMDIPEEIGFDEETIHHQQKLTDAYTRMGGIKCHTCTPYLIGHVPKFGEHIAWGESSAVAFANSVLGARTNREGGPSAVAAAIAGRVPAYGYHLDENRKGEYLVEVEIPLENTTDYGSLGYWVGKRVGGGVPVFTGVSKEVSIEALKMLGAALASSGSVALYHIIGVTPEAKTYDDAFKGNTPKEIYSFTQSELQEADLQLNKHQAQPVSLVALGCPHSSISEVKEIAELLDGKRVKTELWVMCSQPVKSYAQRCGFEQIIKNSGGKIVVDTCPVLAAMDGPMKKNQLTAMATNSAKLAHYAPGQWGIPTYYGNVDKCINAAVKGEF